MASGYIALIPAFEPDRRMLSVIADLGKTGFDIVLVDDGSGPEYSELFEQAAERLPGKTGKGVTLLIHDTNKGKGAALRTGLDYINNFIVRSSIESEENAAAHDFVIVTVDADGQHLASDAFRIACEAAARPGTLILGSRSMNCSRSSSADGAAHSWLNAAAYENETQATEKPPLRSRLGNGVTRKVFRLATGRSIYDTQTGLRAFTADMIPELLAIKGERYEYEINVLMELAGRGAQIEEVPVETVYHDGNSASHFDTIRDSYRIYREIISYSVSSRGIHRSLLQAAKFSASSFASFLVDYAVYALLLLIGSGLVFANIGARIISSVFNFTVNRRMVFASRKSIAGSAIQYFALAGIILAGNTVVLSAMTDALGINRMLAKIFTEIIFFIISWTVQKYVIFYNDAGDEGQSSTEGRPYVLGVCDDENSGSQIYISSTAGADSGSEAASKAGAGTFTVSYRAVRPRPLREVRYRA